MKAKLRNGKTFEGRLGTILVKKGVAKEVRAKRKEPVEKTEAEEKQQEEKSTPRGKSVKKESK